MREVQERRAREASAEGIHSTSVSFDDESKAARPLELLSGGTIQPTNPLVAAALKRIERAHTPSQFSGNTVVASLPAYEEHQAFDLGLKQFHEEPNVGSSQECALNQKTVENLVSQAEKTHKLSVVSPTVTIPNEITVVCTEAPVTLEKDSKTPVRPKRLIRENDPALNYLDSVPTSVKLEVREPLSASVFFRMFSAVIDLVIVCLLAGPVVALIKLTDLHWQDPRAIGFAAGTLVIAVFLYLTISTALTGRTFAMRLCSIRVVDSRTGLIPTGTQSAGRALIYILSLATAGIAFIFMFTDRERRTAHDRFSRTAVVRV